MKFCAFPRYPAAGYKTKKCSLCGKEEHEIYMAKLNSKLICKACYEELEKKVLRKLIVREIEKGWNPSKRERNHDKK